MRREKVRVLREEAVKLLREMAGQDYDGYRPDGDPTRNRTAMESIRAWARGGTSRRGLVGL
jgi:hypothetical protein